MCQALHAPGKMAEWHDARSFLFKTSENTRYEEARKAESAKWQSQSEPQAAGVASSGSRYTY